MKNYNLDTDGIVDLTDLEFSGLLLKDVYAKAHEGLVIVCHDIFVGFDNGILLVRRNNVPAKDLLWPLGGRVLRGVPIVESLKQKVFTEANLIISDVKELGFARTFFNSEPFGHGHGTDTINFVYSGRSNSSIRLDDLHTQPTIVSCEDYSKIRSDLHPYVSDFMDLAFKEF